MAKATGINKRLLAKKDMNFFAEFTANAAKQARLLGYAVVAGFLVFFVVLTFIIALFIRNTLIKADIARLEAKLQSDEYSGLEQEAAVLTEQLNDMTNYYYALSQMRKQVDVIDPVKTNLPDVIAKCIPSDSFITTYTISNSQLALEGYTFTYYSPADLVNMLNANDVFTTKPLINVVRAQPSTDNMAEEEILSGKINAINNYYKFSISGMLVSDVHITISRYQDGTDKATSIGGVETMTCEAEKTYEIPDVNTYVYAGVTYNLTRIFVNGVQVEEGSFGEVLEANAYVDTAHGNADIKLYYTPAQQAGIEG